MSAGNDRNKDGAQAQAGEGDESHDDLSAEIDRAMAEAAAAVSDLKTSTDGEDEEVDVVELMDEAPAEADRVGELEGENAALKDKWLRAVADHDNYKKRVKREIEEAVTRATQKLLPAFLPVMDNLERALEIAVPATAGASDENEGNVQQLVQGIRMVRDEFIAALRRNGIEPVQSVGRPFDPAVHDALQQFDSPDHAPGVVIREFEKGYKLGERLIRPARVIVAGAGSTGAPPDGQGAESEGGEGG